jgi:hypothetical protein
MENVERRQGSMINRLIDTCRIMALLSFFFFSSAVLAQSDDNDLSCGMEMTEDGQKVKSGDFTICEEDIAFQGLYILYAEVLGDNAYKDLFLLFLDEDVLDNEFTNFANNTLGVSEQVYFLLSAMAVVGWLIMSPLVGYKGWRLVTHFQKTGSFDFAESQGDSVKFIAYVFTLIILAAPAGFSGGQNGDKYPLMVGQVLAITFGLPSIQTGNYIFSTHLRATDIASTEIDLKEDFLLPGGQDVANKFVEMRLCESETRNALLSVNAKPESEFFQSFTFSEMFEFDHENIIGRYDNCLSYVGKATQGAVDNSIEVFTMDKSVYTTDYCSGGYSYKPDSYGYQHSCGKVQYDYGQKKFSVLIDSEHSETGDDMDDVLENVQSLFDVAKIYRLFELNIREEVKSILADSSMTSQEKYSAIDDLVLEQSSVISAELGSQSLLSSGTNEEQQAKFMAAGSALLGGKYTGTWRDDVAYLMRSGSFGDWRAKAYLPVNYEDEDIDEFFAVDVFLNEAEIVAEDIRAHYCATNWESNYDTRIAITDFNRLANEDEDSFAELIGSRSISYRCIKFLAEEEQGDTDFDRYVTYVTDDDRAFDDLVLLAGGAYGKSSDTDLMTSTQEYMIDTVAKELHDDIRYRIMIMAGYTAAVKKGVTEALSDSLSIEEAEAAQDLNLRPRGWGIFGGALLYNGRTKTSASHLSKTIEGLITVESGGAGLNFVEPAAFGQDFSGSETESLVNRLYGGYSIDEFINIGFSGVNDYEGPDGIKSDDMKSQEALETFMGYMENLLFSPMVHIKSASGMDMSRSFDSGLQECFDEGHTKCLTGAKHPIVALSDFGSDLLDNMLTLMVVHGVLKVVVSGMDGDSAANEGNMSGEKAKGNSWWAKSKNFASKMIETVAGFVAGIVKLILTVIMKIMEIAYVMLDLLMPVIMTLAITGIIFAYLLPMLAYIYGFMMLLMFWIGVFSVALIIPIYLCLKFWGAEKDYMQGFFKMYQDFSGPYATPLFFSISAVVSWSMMIVLLYAVNISFSVLSIGLESAMSGSSFGLSVLFFKIFIYVVYFVALFVLFKFILGIMKTMPDMLREKANMKRGNDEKYIESLGFEQYVAGQVGSQLTQTLAKMPEKMASAVHSAAKNGGFRTTTSLKREAEQAEQTLANMRALHQQLDANGGAADMPNSDMEENLSNTDIERARENASAPTSEEARTPSSAEQTDERSGPDNANKADKGPSSLDSPGANKSKVTIEPVPDQEPEKGKGTESFDSEDENLKPSNKKNDDE